MLNFHFSQTMGCRPRLKEVGKSLCIPVNRYFVANSEDPDKMPHMTDEMPHIYKIQNGQFHTYCINWLIANC